MKTLTAILLWIPALAVAKPLSTDAPPNWELTLGAGQAELQFEGRKENARSRHVAVAFRPLRWLGAELGYARVSEADLWPRFLRVRSESFRLGPALYWVPLPRLEFSAKALASYHKHFRQWPGGTMPSVDPRPAPWRASNDFEFVPAAGVKLALSKRIWAGIEYETERLWQIDSRTWKTHLSVRW